MIFDENSFVIFFNYSYCFSNIWSYKANGGTDATVEVRQKVEVNLGGGDDIWGGVWAYGNLHLTKAEYSRALYCDATNYGPAQGSGEEAGGTGGDAVVGTGGNWPSRGKGDGGGGGGGRGCGGGRWWVGVLIPYFWRPHFGFWAPPSTSQDYTYDESRMTDRRLSDVL